MRSSRLFILVSATLGLAFISCRHEPEELIVGQPVPAVCDSSRVTYPVTVFPILQERCISCHSGTAPSGGLDFSDYNNVAMVADNGSLMGSIRHDEGFSPMPQGGAKLTDCEIALIAKWVNDTTFEPGGGGLPCNPDTVYFQNTVLPLLQSSCGVTGCHDPATASDGVILTSYLYVIQTAGIDPFQPEESEIWEVITEDDPDKRMPPPPGPSLTDDQKNIIYDWIAQGALNNYCDQEPCDSLNVSFSQTVWPVIQNKCLGCHSSGSPSGNVGLTGHTEVASAGAIPHGLL